MVRRAEKGTPLKKYGRMVVADLADQDALAAACQGVDTVVHLAGVPDPAAAWDKLLEANVIGTANVFAAAKAAGCRRVVFASSIHAVSGYPGDVQVRTTEPVNPRDLYGVSKCFGEALGRFYAEQQDLSVIVLRIGAFQKRSGVRRAAALDVMESFVSRRDLTALIVRCIDDETLRFAIFHGLSNNRFKRLDISDARELIGYAPQDDFTNENVLLKPLKLAKTARAGR